MLEKVYGVFNSPEVKKVYEIFPSTYKFFVGRAEVSFRPTSKIVKNLQGEPLRLFIEKSLKPGEGLFVLENTMIEVIFSTF